MFSALEVCGISSKYYKEFESQAYIDTINTLNTLQYKYKDFNQNAVDNATAPPPPPPIQKPVDMKLMNTIKYLKRSGMLLNELDTLSVIHVSGTKGKGSTCALTESILRSFGLKTGFFSSPHLISVTERIRLNGQPIIPNKLIQYFWKVYNKLNDEKENDLDMPSYFQFLTILCFHIFLMEKVDVAIIEVGIGGENDCTNIVRNTQTVGITSVGLEHVAVLGHTLAEIAWHKAGIIKENSNVFTIKQREECMNVIEERVKNKNAILKIIPESQNFQLKQLKLNNQCQYLNISLAIELCNHWLENNRSDIKVKENCEKLMYEGIINCHWPGRCQLINYKNFKFYVDGAHTMESINVCIDWFQNQTISSDNPKILIFNATGVRDSIILLKEIKNKLKFMEGFFIPNIPYHHEDGKNQQCNPDIQTFVPDHKQIERTKIHAEFWESNNHEISKCFPCILDGLKYLTNQYSNYDAIDILVTGSIHLIGSTILAIEKYQQFINQSC